MHARTPDLVASVRRARGLPARLELLRGAFEGLTAVIATCGPSLDMLPADTLRHAVRGVPCFVVKQAIDIVRLEADLHCWNAYNVRRFDRYSPDTLRCIVEEPTGRVPQWNRYDIGFPQVDGRGNLARSVAHSRDFDAYLLDRGGPLPFGPGIMFELVLYLVVHMGVSDVLTIGWDIANPMGANTHFYDSADDTEFFQRGRRPEGQPVPHGVRQRLPQPLRRVGRVAKTRLAHSRGATYNRTTPLPGESDAVSEATADVVSWLASHGVAISALSDSEFVGRHVPLLAPDDFLDRLAAAPR